MKALLLLANFLGAGLVAFSLNWLALIPFRRSKGKHWTEKARALYPAQVGAGGQVWQIPVIVAFGQWVLLGDDAPHWILAGFSAWAGVVLGSYLYSREISPDVTAREWLHHVVAGWSVAFLWFGIVVGIAVLMPAELGLSSWVLLAVFFAICVAWAFGASFGSERKLAYSNPLPNGCRKSSKKCRAA